MPAMSKIFVKVQLSKK